MRIGPRLFIYSALFFAATVTLLFLQMGGEPSRTRPSSASLNGYDDTEFTPRRRVPQRSEKKHEYLGKNKIVDHRTDNVGIVPERPTSTVKSSPPSTTTAVRWENVVKPVTQVDLDQLALIKTPDDEVMRKAGYDKFAFNGLISDRIGDRREIMDSRAKLCAAQVYPTSLPSTSIIICYYNEASSALIRMINGILDRTPPGLIHEILIIDDMSDYHDDNERISKYMEENWPSSIIKMVRTTERKGLIRAKVFGASIATGEVLVFLDSHCEVNRDWLQPMLARIANDPHTVVCPIIDIIDSDSFKYVEAPVCYGGLNWALFFKWDYPKWNELKTPEDYIKPIRSPTMAGGLFAIRKDYFHHLGEYDLGMDVWGAENVEMSFRIWMCGGTLEIVPCSRIGHIFRKRRPYGGGSDTMAKNSIRTARVWMDQYIEYFYKDKPRYRSMDVGDISERVALRERLQCKSFEWFITNIYPELMPSNKTKAIGQPRFEEKVNVKVLTSFVLNLESTESCLCNPRRDTVKGVFVALCPCDDQVRQQQWDLTDEDELRLRGTRLCLSSSDLGVQLMKCTMAGGEQEWKRHGDRQYFSPASGKCLAVDSGRVGMSICDETSSGQWWDEIVI